MNKVILLILIGLICVHAEEENVNVEADIPIESLESLEPIDLPRQVALITGYEIIFQSKN